MRELGIDWKILLGQIINFLILLFLLRRFVFKPFLAILEKRRNRIEEGIKNAQAAEKSLENIRNLAGEFKQKSEKEARDLIIAAEAKSRIRAEEIMQKVNEEKKIALEEAKRIIQRETEEEAKKKEKEITEKAFILTEKLLKEKLDENRDKKIIEGLLANLK